MLGIVDFVLLACSLVITLAIGVYHGIKGRNATPAEYMLGGRAMSPLPLAMSMMVGTISPITIMGNIGEMYTYGTQLWIMDIGLVIGMLIVAQVFIPIFYPLKMVSLYQYIEKRFESKVLRMSSVLITLLAAYLFIGFLLYPPSTFLVYFTNLSMVPNIVIMGLVCGLYSAFGGVKAVVHTDVVQSLVMLVGVLAIVVQGCIKVGGLSKVWQIASDHDRIEFFNMNPDPYQRHSFWLTLIFGLFFSLSTYGVNQSQTQRTFSTGSVKQAQKVMYYAIVGMVLLRFLINLAGVVIFSFYVDCDPLTAGGKVQPNLLVVVSYVLQDLIRIPGLAGLFVASIYAAVLSSVSTQVNSMTALLWEDFLKNRKYFQDWSEVKITWLQKLLVFLTSVLGIVMSLIAAESPAFISSLFRLTGAISGPMVGLFLTGLYLPWVKGKSAAFGLVMSIIFSFGIVTGQLLTQDDPPFRALSRDGCAAPAAGLNVTAIINDTMLTTDATMDVSTTTLSVTSTPMSRILNDTEELATSRSAMDGLYGLSYCLNYCWGTLSCMIVALIATLLTGWNTPDTLDEKLISPIAWRLFIRPMTFTPPLKQLTKLIWPDRHAYRTSEDTKESPRDTDGVYTVNNQETVPMNSMS